jgi:ribonuclease E
MGLFRRKSAEVIRRGVGNEALEERKLRKVRGQLVEVRRVQETQRPEPPVRTAGENGGQSRTAVRTKRPPARRPRPREEAIVAAPEAGRKQMLVRVLPHQTQIVILEGPVLVEHYIARQERRSLVGNVYLGKVKNVLPGMEAAFIDFGEPKNGVLYAGDVHFDFEDLEGQRHPRIEMALHPGDDVLVQVVKDAMGHKGARLTNEVSLAGRYLVLVPESDVKGISRRLPEEERERLREVVRRVRPKGSGVIVRTAAEQVSEEAIKEDIARLAVVWEQIQAEEEKGSAPHLLHEEPPLVLRVIREHFGPEFRRLLIDDDHTYQQVIAYLEDTAPDLVDRVQLYREQPPLFERFHVEDQLRKALDRKVWLPSGGHVVIDRAEALTVVDVNTGKFVGHSNLEETVLQNNLEAAEEIGRQLRLRDIGGIIVIDFIDMESERNRQAVLRRLKEVLAKDRTRTQVFEVSHLGLVEMTRKNVSEGLLESFSEVCPHCAGRGVLLHEDSAISGAARRGVRGGGSERSASDQRGAHKSDDQH